MNGNIWLIFCNCLTKETALHHETPSEKWSTLKRKKTTQKRKKTSGLVLQMKLKPAMSVCSPQCVIIRADSKGVGVGVGGGCSLETSFDSKFNFRGNFFINLDYCIYPKYSRPCALPYTSLQQVHFTPCTIFDLITAPCASVF